MIEVNNFVLEYLIFDVDKLEVIYICYVECFELLVEINEVLIVEFYFC